MRLPGADRNEILGLENGYGKRQIIADLVMLQIVGAGDRGPLELEPCHVAAHLHAVILERGNIHSEDVVPFAGFAQGIVACLALIIDIENEGGLI